jgi:3-phosphoshikimate 1-carboxyvinyltransferase
MDSIDINKALSKRNLGSVIIPGSKSITNRALCLAAFSFVDLKLTGVLFSDDTRHCMQSLVNMGFSLEIDEKNKTVSFSSEKSKLKNNAEFNIGSAGTTARFLPPILSNFRGEWTINCSEQMASRPMKEVFEAIANDSVSFVWRKYENHLPVILRSTGEPKKEYQVRGERSSQFLSGLLLSGAFNKNAIEINVVGDLVARTYVDITLNVLKSFGVEYQNIDYRKFRRVALSKPNISEYQIEPDMSSACYFMSIPVLCGGKIFIEGLSNNSMQGDKKFIDVLEALGATVEFKENGLLISHSGEDYDGIDVDMELFSDQALTLAAIAIFAKSPTRIRNINHLEFQETKRISACMTEMAKLGVKVERTSDGMIIYPSLPKYAEIETYDDHRMAMSFSLIGLKAGNIRILNPLCCRKTFPDYFDTLKKVLENAV